MTYLLDTDTCIYIMRRRPPSLRQRLETLELGLVGVSSITVAELQYGAEKSEQVERNLQALEQFLLPLVIHVFDYEAAAAYGRVRAELEALGTPIRSLDTLIAGHALSLRAILVTNNQREFSRVSGLTLENWFQA